VRRQSLVAQVNLTPLLDVVFIFLFALFSIVTDRVESDREVERLEIRERKEEFQDRARRLEERSRRLQEESERLYQQITSRDSKISSLALQVDQLQEERARQDDLLSKVRRERDHLLEQVQNLDEEIDRRKEETRGLGKRIASLEQKRSQGIEERDQLAHRIVKLDGQLATVRKQRDELTGRVGSLSRSEQALLERLEKKSSELARVRSGLEQERTRLEHEMDVRKSHIEQMGQVRAGLEADLKRLSGEKERVDRKLVASALRLKEKNLQIEELTSRVEKCGQELRQVRTGLTQVRKQRDDYREELKRVQVHAVADPVGTSLKAEIADRHFAVYKVKIEAEPGDRRLSRLSVHRRGDEPVVSEPIQSSDRVHRFLIRLLPPSLEANRTIVLFLKTESSLFQHEKWVEDWLRERGFLLGVQRIQGR
jgi:chromosome segregation ATPase